MSEYETLRRHFEHWTEQCRQAMGVVSLKHIRMMHEMLEDQREFFKRHHNKPLNDDDDKSRGLSPPKKAVNPLLGIRHPASVAASL
ncbi:hypothetical protein B0H19DRAFT_1170937 [Mycena capillaripes]|nr:hypothetical protein B0H19DRAFT_1170937 [Mycena capillaripes]